ncbi:hypothetical protein ACTJKU_13500, partial [Citrobacter freundii]
YGFTIIFIQVVSKRWNWWGTDFADGYFKNAHGRIYMLNLLCGVRFLMNWCLIYLYVFNGLFCFLFKKYSFRNA